MHGVRLAVPSVLLVLLAMAPIGLAAAQTTRPPEVAPEAVAAIARDLNCPLCQGTNLQDCPLTVCAQMRDEIRARLAAGATREAIVAAFVADYGPQVLNEPPARGVFLAAWLLPALALLAGALVVLGVVRRGSRRATAPAVPTATAPAVDPEAADRLELLLREEDSR